MTLSEGSRLGPYEILRSDPSRHYDVSADGQRFLLNMPLGEETSPPITLIQNWAVLLRQAK
jgi:hypothetical protein